ncbi:MAG: hypothetical protein P8J27_10250 [Mariniblastus sp.]|nr:hypothetical protein [Mariniblastus sp.]
MPTGLAPTCHPYPALPSYRSTGPRQTTEADSYAGISHRYGTPHFTHIIKDRRDPHVQRPSRVRQQVTPKHQFLAIEMPPAKDSPRNFLAGRSS